jgi:beta-glucanase (GH16 family)
VLRLQTKRHERYKETENGSQVTIYHNKIGVGLVSSENTFTYGTYEADVMLPKGTGLFPAFWLYSASTWPPEIDIFEAWSRKSGLYTSKGLPYFSLASNVHYGEEPNHPHIKSKSHLVFKKFDECFINFRLEWTPDRIEIFYNSRSVRKVTDQNILDWFNRDPSMWVIFNNGIEEESLYTNDSVMQVKNFKYTPNT